MSPERRLHLVDVLQQAVDGLAPLPTQVSDGLERLRSHDTAHLDLVAEWEAARNNPTSRADLVALDRAVDLTCGQLYRMIRDHIAARGAADPVSKDLEALLQEAFPAGLAAHVRLPHAEQLAQNARLVRVLSAPVARGLVDSIAVGWLVDRLSTDVAAFAAAFALDQHTSLYTRVRDSELTAHDLLAELVMAVFVTLSDAPAARESLLDIIDAHAEADRAASRRPDSAKTDEAATA